MGKLSHLTQYILCTVFVVLLFSFASLITSEPAPSIESVLIVGLALTWAMAKDREHKNAK